MFLASGLLPNKHEEVAEGLASWKQKKIEKKKKTMSKLGHQGLLWQEEPEKLRGEG